MFTRERDFVVESPRWARHKGTRKTSATEHSMPKAHHPSQDELAAYSLGQLSEDHAVLIDDHITACEPCCETIAGLSSDDTFMEALQEANELSVGEIADMTIDMPASTLLDQAKTEVPVPLAEHARYEIRGLIGQGGMGRVFEARHRMMDRPVALKVIHREWVRKQEAIDRFRREVQTAASLDHPNIVTAHDAEQAGDLHFLVMEYVDGTDLAQAVKQNGPMPIQQACDYIRQAAQGLQYAHDRGMVHRDIKPHNLMVTSDQVVKILDFGLASFSSNWTEASTSSADDSLSSPNLTVAGAVMGTPDFISPEQAQDARTADGRSDIYSLGMTLYYLLSGKAPFVTGSAAEKLKLQAEADPPSLDSVRKDIPSPLIDVIQRMIAKDPSQRFQSPAEVATALQPFTEAPKPQPKTAGSGGKSFRGTAVLAAGFFAAVLAAIVYYIKTDVGTIKVVVNDPTLKVLIDQDEIKVDGKTIQAGNHKLSITQEGSELSIESTDFTVRRGDDIVMTVTLEDQKLSVKKDGDLMLERPVPTQKSSVAAAPGTTLGSESKPSVSERGNMSADNIVRRLQDIHGNLSPKLQVMLSEAAGIPNGQWDGFATSPTGSTDGVKGEPLSLALLKLDPLQASIKNLTVLDDFQYIGRVPKMSDLSEAMSASRSNGYHSLLQPDFFGDLTFQIKAGALQTAKIIGHAEFQAKGLYAGKVQFVIQADANADLTVTEFTLPNYGLKVHRDADGTWVSETIKPIAQDDIPKFRFDLAQVPASATFVSGWSPQSIFSDKRFETLSKAIAPGMQAPFTDPQVKQVLIVNLTPRNGQGASQNVAVFKLANGLSTQKYAEKHFADGPEKSRFVKGDTIIRGTTEALRTHASALAKRDVRFIMTSASLNVLGGQAFYMLNTMDGERHEELQDAGRISPIAQLLSERRSLFTDTNYVFGSLSVHGQPKLQISAMCKTADVQPAVSDDLRELAKSVTEFLEGMPIASPQFPIDKATKDSIQSAVGRATLREVSDKDSTLTISLKSVVPGILRILNALPAPVEKPDVAVPDAKAALQGQWQLVQGTNAGKPLQVQKMNADAFFAPDWFLINYSGKTLRAASYRLDSTTEPKTIHWTHDGIAKQGIYKIEQGKLTICLTLSPAEEKPVAFESNEKTSRLLMTLEPKPEPPPSNLPEFDDTILLQLLPRAASLSNEDFDAMEKARLAERNANTQNQSLTWLMLTTNRHDFELGKVQGATRNQIVGAAWKSRRRGYLSILQPQYITSAFGLIDENDFSLATGVITFKAPNAYKGQLRLRMAKDVDTGKWQITEFLLKNRGQKLVHGKDGNWKLVEITEE